MHLSSYLNRNLLTLEAGQLLPGSSSSFAHYFRECSAAFLPLLNAERWFRRAGIFDVVLVLSLSGVLSATAPRIEASFSAKVGTQGLFEGPGGRTGSSTGFPLALLLAGMTGKLCDLS
jgi:hypothetical protein